jgi:hypothetical protein
MKRTLFAALILVLVASLGLPEASAAKISRLRLERATTPGGEWEHLPAETLPIADSEFEDSFDATTGFYRLRIDVLDDDRPPAAIPLPDVPPRARNLAQQYLDENADIEGDNSWQDVTFAPVAFPMYNPAVPGIAYMEFKVVSKPEEQVPLGGDIPAQIITNVDRQRGFILVSTGPHDYPIVSWATEGPTRTEMLREMAESTGVRIFRYGAAFYVAENAAGKMVAHLGSEPIKYPDTICDFMGQEWEHTVDEQGEYETPGAPDLQGEAFESYAAFKQAYLNTEYFKRARRVRAEEATLKWDVYDGFTEGNVLGVLVNNEVIVAQEQKIERFIVGDPSLFDIEILELGLSITGKKVGATLLHVFFVGGGQAAYGLNVTEEAPLSPETPASCGWSSWTYYTADGDWSAQRRYNQFTYGSCAVGCGPCAWAMLFGWFDYMGLCDLIGPSGTGNAPLYNTSYVRDCMKAVNGYVNTYCVGSSGATNPWDMTDGYKWATIDCGESRSTSTTYSIPCFPSSGCREKARDCIRYDDTPAIIGLYCTSAHYCVAYKYAWRKYTCAGITWDYSRWFKCNMGWGGSSGSWEEASVWYGNRTDFW